MKASNHEGKALKIGLIKELHGCSAIYLRSTRTQYFNNTYKYDNIYRSGIIQRNCGIIVELYSAKLQDIG